ncbi:MAG: peroxiredoxin [Candidatus Izemoplasmatales bacterium]|jgi:peroxiredoxin Q/BCP
MEYLDIRLWGSDDKEHSLGDFLGTKVLLYFYPKDDTPGCTTEAKDFTALKDKFKAKGYQIIGVSRDSKASHKRFCQKHGLDILLLSDTDSELVNAFTVLKEKSLYGKKYLGIDRSTFLLDEKGQIVKEYRGVSPTNHAITILETI